MQLVRQVQYKRSRLLDAITFASKNLFNVATYTVRQRLFRDHHWIRYTELWHLLKTHVAYQKLHDLCGSHPPQQVLRQVNGNFTSFFQAIKAWKNAPARFRARPKLPKYKRKHGRNLVYFTVNTIARVMTVVLICLTTTVLLTKAIRDQTTKRQGEASDG